MSCHCVLSTSRSCQLLQSVLSNCPLAYLIVHSLTLVTHSHSYTHAHCHTATHVHCHTATHMYTVTQLHMHVHCHTATHMYTVTQLHMYCNTATHVHCHTATHVHCHMCTCTVTPMCTVTPIHSFIHVLLVLVTYACMGSHAKLDPIGLLLFVRRICCIL